MGNKIFHSVGELYLVKGLSLESLSKLLLPKVILESQNELEDADIPLSISLVEAMEQRYKNILEELREGYKKEAQEHSYAVAEAYHYVGLALYMTSVMMRVQKCIITRQLKNLVK